MMNTACYKRSWRQRQSLWLAGVATAWLLVGCSSVGIGVGIPVGPLSVGVGLGSGGLSAGAGLGPVGLGVNQSGQVSAQAGVGVGRGPVHVGVGASTPLNADTGREAVQTAPAPELTAEPTAVPTAVPTAPSSYRWRDAQGREVPACRVEGRC